MKKISAILCAMLVSFVGLFAQPAEWGKMIDWKSAFYIYAAGTNYELNENQEMCLLYNDFRDDYITYKNDEFEWEDVKAKDLKKIKDDIASYKNYKDEKYFMVTTVEFGTYDFEKQGYPIEITPGAFFQYYCNANYDSYKHKDAMIDLALYFNDFSEYNFFPLEKSKAKSFQTARKDRHGNIDREIMLVIHYSLEDFASDDYKNIKSMFKQTKFTPLLGKISSIEIFDKNDNKIGDLVKSK